MGEFISTIIFTLPGLICYYWLQLFGITPNQKHNPFEMVGISALLWMPVSVLSIVAYNFLVLMYNLFLDWMESKVNISLIELRNEYISDLTSLNDHLTSFPFVITFLLFSLISSYWIARVYTKLFYKLILKNVNKIREKRDLNKLSNSQTVWEEIFITKGSNVVEISKIDGSEKLVGGIEKVSRPLEPERNLTLTDTHYFTELINKYDLKPEKYYIDVRTGIKIGIYNKEEIKNSQIIDDASSDPIV